MIQSGVSHTHTRTMKTPTLAAIPLTIWTMSVLLPMHFQIVATQKRGSQNKRRIPSSSGSRPQFRTPPGYSYEDYVQNGRVFCYTCSKDFTNDRLTVNNTCILPNDRNAMAICSINDKYCKVEVTRVNGVLLTFVRSCADSCYKSCYEKGYGILKVTCTYCCEGSESPDCGELGPRAVSLSPPAPPLLYGPNSNYP